MMSITQPPTGANLPVSGYQIVRVYPHDPKAFTQGLQYVDGVFYEGTGQVGQSSIRKVEIFANVWQTDYVARISPETGKVTGYIDLRGLLTPAERSRTDVLNGIAYDAEHDRLFVTGKWWPKLFEIKVIAKAR